MIIKGLTNLLRATCKLFLSPYVVCVCGTESKPVITSHLGTIQFNVGLVTIKIFLIVNFLKFNDQLIVNFS